MAVLVTQLCWLFATPWTVAYQASLSVGFPRQEYWSGFPFPSSDPGIKLQSLALAGRLPVSPRGSPWNVLMQSLLKVFAILGHWFQLQQWNAGKVDGRISWKWLPGFEQRFNLAQCTQGSIAKIPWSRKWEPTPVFLPGKSHGQRSLVDYSPWGRKESNTSEWLHF